MTPEDYRAALTRDMDHLRRLLAEGDLSAGVPGCPDWTLAHLGSHVADVYQFATTAIVEDTWSDVGEEPHARDTLLARFDAGRAALDTALAEHDHAAPCRTLGPPKVVGFWLRRMCQETSLHLWDACEALGEPHAIEPGLAADGVREVLTVFFPRQVRLGRIEPLAATLQLEASDVAGEPLLLGGDGVSEPAGPPAAVLTGPAASLLLLLWRRRSLAALADPADPAGVTVSGDRAAAESVLATALTT